MPEVRPEEETRLDAINMVFKMYDLHYKASFKEGARRPFRIEWTGGRSSTNENTFQFGAEAFVHHYTGRTHFFETCQLMDDFVHKRLRKRGLQGV